LDNMIILKNSNARILNSIMNAVIPANGPFPAGASDFDLLDGAEKLIQSYDPVIKGAIPLMLRYVQYSSIIHTGKFFTSLSPAMASEFLDKMEKSAFWYRRMVALFFKLITTLCFYEIDKVSAQIGYEYACVMEKKKNKPSVKKAK
jgi:hypothetical protein